MPVERSVAPLTVEIRILRAGDASVLANVASDLFDKPVDRDATTAFLADPRHHIAVAIDGGVVVGFASGVHYFHPDKPAPELFVNEVGVCPTHQKRGIAKDVLRALLQRARELGCVEAWVLTDRSNAAAMRLYSSSGGSEAATDQVMFSFPLEPSALSKEVQLRKQYYFRPSDRGLLAWDVDRLVELSAAFPRMRVPLSGFGELDEPWFGKDEPGTWRNLLEHVKLMDDADLSYPIILAADGSVMDGRHRIAKAVRTGHTHIEAVRFEVDPPPDHIGKGPDDLPY